MALNIEISLLFLSKSQAEETENQQLEEAFHPGKFSSIDLKETSHAKQLTKAVAIVPTALHSRCYSNKTLLRKEELDFEHPAGLEKVPP